MFDFSGASPGDEVNADDIVVVVRPFGESWTYLFDRSFFEEFRSFISDLIHSRIESRDDFETPYEHLERIGFEFEVFEFFEDGIWEGIPGE